MVFSACGCPTSCHCLVARWVAKICALFLGGPGPVVLVSVKPLCGNGFFRLVMGLQLFVLSHSSSYLRLSNFVVFLIVLLSLATCARSPCWRSCPLLFRRFNVICVIYGCLG